MTMGLVREPAQFPIPISCAYKTSLWKTLLAFSVSIFVHHEYSIRLKCLRWGLLEIYIRLFQYIQCYINSTSFLCAF